MMEMINADLGNTERYRARYPWSGAPSGLGVLKCCCRCGSQRAEPVLVYNQGQWAAIVNSELQQGLSLDVEWLEANGFHPRDTRWSGQHVDGRVCQCVSEAEGAFWGQSDKACPPVDGDAQLDGVRDGADGDFRAVGHSVLQAGGQSS